MLTAPAVDRILIEALEVECIVGVRPLERRRKQLVRLDLELAIDLAPAGRTGRIVETVDYARVADEVGALLRFREYQLIEVATEELAAMLFGVHRALKAVRIRLEKPEALRGRARSASVEIQRTRAECPSQLNPHDFGEHELLLTTHEARLEMFRFSPGASVPLAAPDNRRLEWVVSGQLTRDGKPLDREPRERATGIRSHYRNGGADPAALFRCDWAAPPFVDQATLVALGK